MKMKWIYILIFMATSSYAQFSITLKYKKPKCGGARPVNTDTTSYFLLTNKKWIIQYPSQKIDTIYSDIDGKIKLPNKKGTYCLYEPWKYYHQAPPDFPIQFYNINCLEKHWNTPDFKIKICSNKKYKIIPLHLTLYCPDKHPCLRTDTVIPRIPYR